jgi:hypothetical protein
MLLVENIDSVNLFQIRKIMVRAITNKITDKSISQKPRRLFAVNGRLAISSQLNIKTPQMELKMPAVIKHCLVLVFSRESIRGTNAIRASQGIKNKIEITIAMADIAG